jgi:hypothetical protein
MKLLPGISLIVLGTLFIAFPFAAFAMAPPSSLDGRAIFLIALCVAGAVFEALGVRDLVRAKRSGVSPASSAP